VAQQFKVNQGSADKLVALYKFNETTLVAFKERSVYAIFNVYGDLTAAQQDQLTDQFGCVAPDSIVQVGKDLWFLSQLGVMSIQQTEQNKLQGVVLPVSEPIDPLIQRIVWLHAAEARAAYLNSTYYLAVPLDQAEVFGEELVPQGSLLVPTNLLIPGLVVGKTYRYVKGQESQMSHSAVIHTRSTDFVAASTFLQLNYTPGSLTLTASVREVRKGVNTAVLVFDFMTGRWAGHDETPGMSYQRLTLFTVNDRQRLLMATTEGWMVLYEEGFDDQLLVPYVDVHVLSRPVLESTIQVNSGAIITAFDTGQSATIWHVGTEGSPLTTQQCANNLWADGGYAFGYSHGVTNTVWSAPNTVTSKSSDGVRFLSTNGVLPSVVTVGVWADVRYFTSQAIRHRFITRAYTDEQLKLQDFHWLMVDFQTWDPSLDISVLPDGVNETGFTKTGLTKSRARYYRPAHTPDFVKTNVNDDFNTPHREDYSIALGVNEAPEFDVKAGCKCDEHQAARETLRIAVFGRNDRSARVELACNQGRMRVMGLRLLTNAQMDRAGTEV
jgi:hypothetical protein